VREIQKVKAEVNTCPTCGRENAEGARVCFCGTSLIAAEPPAPVGVGGWLLFFWVQITVLAPVVVFYEVASEVRILVTQSALASPVGLMILLDSLVRMSLMALGVVVGILLWRRSAGAVRYTRAYLLSVPAVYAALIFLPLAFGIPPAVRGPILLLYLKRAAFTVPSTIFWSIYFVNSRRVQATYPNTATARAA